MEDVKSTISILGGTGAQGGGLALRFANAGHPVVIGSRDADKAAAAAREIASQLPHAKVSGTDLHSAASQGTVVILTVPFASQKATVEAVAPALAGKILIDATVPLVPPKVARVQLPESDSAVAAVQAMLGETVRVVSAFQNVSAWHLKDLHHDVDCDVIVCGDDVDARSEVIGLIEAIGLRGIHGGAICNSAAVEALTSVLIAINMRYKVPGSGIRITGLPAK